MLNQSKIS